jgi:hypothetical protein
MTTETGVLLSPKLLPHENAHRTAMRWAFFIGRV